MLSFESKGSFSKANAFLNRMAKKDILSTLDKYGEEGVRALANATPTETGETANAWSYKVEKSGSTYSITWINDHMDTAGQPIAILLQYGHGTGTGGYVQGRDYINPAIKPIFEKIKADVWKEMTT